MGLLTLQGGGGTGFDLKVDHAGFFVVTYLKSLDLKKLVTGALVVAALMHCARSLSHDLLGHSGARCPVNEQLVAGAHAR